MRRWILVLLIALVASPALAGDRVPGEEWMRFEDPAEAGFDPDKLRAAEETWRQLPSSAFLVIADGAVVAAWGDLDRRFMCHSVRKSFLSALYGVYWDRGEIELNKTMADLGIDERAEGLLDVEKQARILDLMKARSGVFHPAAYAGRTDSQARGSQGPGRYFAYNNWDFNTLVTIFEQETGENVFQAFDEHFAGPLGMQDWRITDGYYHYERDKSIHPAYPFRLSARDAARFGLLFAREGRWGDRQVLSRHWVRRSTALYSIDDEIFGYGFMWWVAREPRFEKHGFASALGVGNQMIAALPESDIVIVNRADTYEGEYTPMGALLDLIEQILEARTLAPAIMPTLVALEPENVEPYLVDASDDGLGELVGTWPYPPSPLGLPQQTTVEISAGDGYVVTHSPESGTFKHYLQPDGWLIEEDSHERYLPIRGGDGAVAGIAGTSAIVRSAMMAAAAEDFQTADERMALIAGEPGLASDAGQVILELLRGSGTADESARRLLDTVEPVRLERSINRFGYGFLGAVRADIAEEVFLLNTRLFPEASNTWDSLGEAQMSLGEAEKAIASYQRSLELDPENENAREMIERMRSRSSE